MKLVSFFLKPTNPYNLAIIRILTVSYMLVRSDLLKQALMSTHHNLPFQPVGIFKILSEPLQSSTLETVFYIWIALSLAVLLGFMTRLSTALWVIFSIIVLGYINNFGKVYHSSQIILMIAMILSMSRCGAVISIDALLKNTTPKDSWHYQWPIATIKILVILSFFTLGIQKLSVQGLDWALSDGFYLTIFNQPASTPLAQWIIDQPLWVSKALALWALLVVELMSPLALIRPLNLLFPIIWTSFHIGVSLLFGGHELFFSQVVGYLCFYNYTKIGAWAHTRLSRLKKQQI